MSENEHTTAEDLDLEGSEAEAVVGGRAFVDLSGQDAFQMESQMARLKSRGFVEKECTTAGTLFVNPQTHRHVLVRT
jgi:hypothetical protein